MATIHKLTKDGSTIFPATITDAVVHQDTGKTLTSMIKNYNVSELFPSEGVDGGNKYNLALAISVLGTHLTAAEKTGGISLTFISSGTGYPEEEYFLNKNVWSTNVADWGQRFEVGDVVADPSGSWTPSTAEQYIDQKVGVLNADLTQEVIARQTGDSNLQTQINAEVANRTAADTSLNTRVGTLEDNVAYIGDNDGSSLVADFDPQTDTVWKKPQVLSSAEKAQVQTNINVYGKDQTYTKTEVNGLVDTPHQNYVTVATYAGLPASGSTDTIYRVSNYNGSTSQVDASVYSEYAWNGSAYIFLCVKSQIGEVFDITVYNNNTTYADLAAALGNGGANVPESLRKGGMSVKYVQTSDNKYVQYRLMAQNFTTDTAQWQGVDDEPTAYSKNLVESGGIFNTFKSYGNKMQNISVLSGYNIGADGNLSSGGSQNPFIYNVEGVKFVILRYTIYSGVAVAPYAIYNSLKEFSSTTALVVSATSAKTSPTTYEVMINIPDGAKALLVTSRDAYTPEVYSSNLVMADFIKDATMELEKASTINSKVIGLDGNLIDGSAHQVFAYDINNTYAVLFDYFFKAGSAISEFAFYNSEDTFNSTTVILLGPKTANSSGVNITRFIKVPTGAKRLLVNYRVGEGSVHCYSSKLNKIIDSIKNLINENANTFNQFSNQVKITESVSFAEKNPLTLASLDYVGVNDFHKVRFEGNVGEVYTTTSENVGNQWYTSKLPVQKGFDAIIVGKTSSAFNANILILDSSNAILYKKTFASNNNGFPFYIKVTDYPTAAYVTFMYPTDSITPVYFLPALSQRHELNFEVRSKSEIKAYKYDGTIEPGTNMPFNNYRIDVTKISNFIAYVRQQSGAGVMSICYFDKNDNYISSEYRQTSTAEWNYLLCTVPQNASYAQILSREYYDEEIVGIYKAKVYALTPSDANKYNNIVTNNIATKNVIQHDYSGEKISLNTFTIKEIGREIITAAANNPVHPQDDGSGQACCIYNDYLFRFHNNGYCNIYNIKYLDNITKVNGFELASYGSNNHANCASFSPQIDETTGFPYLYIGFNYNESVGHFYVERISLTGSTLIQTISINIGHVILGNLLIGDDGYLYYFGNQYSGQTNVIEFYKFNCPTVDAGDVTLTAADAIDSWTWTDEEDDVIVQDGFFRNGKLYVCYGQSDGAVRDVDRNINVFDWAKKERVSYVPLKPYESHEPEGIYPYKGKILMVVNGANEAYIIDFI